MPAKTATPAQAASTATDLYLGWVDASLSANERFARIARSWLDETIALQQDMAETIKKAVSETRTASGDETPAAFSRAGDVARTTYYLLTETGLKAQERWGRVAQTAFTELAEAQAAFTSRVEAQMSGVRAASK